MKSHTQPKWIDAANALADLLEAENNALLATDFAAATSLLPAKRAALEHIEFSLPSGSKQENRQAASRLDQLAAQNRTLLARGIGIQAQVLGIIANATRAATASGYNPKGNTSHNNAYFALSAKA
jgi:hypothetical protein